MNETKEQPEGRVARVGEVWANPNRNACLIGITDSLGTQVTALPNGYQMHSQWQVSTEGGWIFLAESLEAYFAGEDECVTDARELLADIANGEVNPEDEAEKWLREYGWPPPPTEKGNDDE